MLAREMKARSLTKVALAERLDCNLSTVWKWLRRERDKRARPDMIAREKLRALFGIPVELWLTAKERRDIASAQKLAATGTDD